MSKNVVIMADSGIPGAYEAFSPFGEVQLLEPSQLTPARVCQADALIVRSVVSVGKELLENAGIQFVGSATAGIDHVDTEYLEGRGIRFAHAPGANADSVADHVLTSLLMLMTAEALSAQNLCLGIVGHGQVGGRVAARAGALGLKVLLCDPPRARSGAEGYVSLDRLLAESDIVSLHTPLTRVGPDATWHLMDQDRLHSFGGWLVNTARGSVVDNRALAALKRDGHGPARLVFDVWENEPRPMRELLDHVDVATPHVAGYASDSKWNATEMMRVALARHLALDPLDPSLAGPPALPRLSHPVQALPAGSVEERLSTLALMMCPLRRDHNALRSFSHPERRGGQFERFRSAYPGRRLMKSHDLLGVPKDLLGPAAAVLGCAVHP